MNLKFRCPSSTPGFWEGEAINVHTSPASSLNDENVVAVVVVVVAAAAAAAAAVVVVVVVVQSQSS